MFADRTDHSRLAQQADARARAAAIADKYIPGADRDVTPVDNQPPGPIDSAKEAFGELSAYLKDNPVIQNPADAKQAGGFVERTRIALSTMETERTERVGPLNAQLSAINGAYRAVRDPLEKALKTLRARLTDYATAVEAARIAEANRLRAEAEAKEAAAREAERAEQEAIAEAEQGACSDVGGAIAEADAAFTDYQKAGRQAAIAERNVPVRIGSVMGGKSLSMRTIEVLAIEDVAKAIKVLGITDGIRDAILSSARAYRKEFGELPAGVVSTYERSL